MWQDMYNDNPNLRALCCEYSADNIVNEMRDEFPELTMGELLSVVHDELINSGEHPDYQRDPAAVSRRLRKLREL